MYLSSNTGLLQGQRECAARKGVISQRCVDQARNVAVDGRVQLFNTLVSPSVLAGQFGAGLGTSAAIMDARSLVARASAVSTGDLPDSGGPSFGQIVSDAPVIGNGPSCSGDMRLMLRRPLGPDPKPGMPKRAPTIVQSPYGPLHFTGQPSTIDPTYGLTGYAPPWSDAFVAGNTDVSGNNDGGVVGWIQAHPLLSLGIAAAGLFAASRGRGR